MRSTRTAKTNPTTMGWHGWPAACGLLIVVAGLTAYFNGFQGAFVFDEDKRIVNNERIQHLWPLWDLLAVHRPVVELSLAINHAMGKTAVWGYHAFNLVVHIVAGLTLFGVVRRTLLGEPLRRRPVMPHAVASATVPQSGTRRVKGEPFRDRYRSTSLWLALAVALLWIVHPLQTQSVTYIIQRGESLMGMFYLLTLYCVIRGACSSHRRRWYATAVLCCGLGMGSKAVMVTAPVVVLLYDRVFLSGSFRETLGTRWGVYLGLGGTWLVLFATGIAQGVLTATPHGTAHVGFGFTGVTPLEYLQSQPGVIAQYLRLSLWPSGLCLDYYWPVARTTWAVLGPLIAVGPLLIGTLWALHTRPRLGFVGAWFFLILFPTSSFIPIKDLAFEHRMYLPLASVVVLVVISVHALLIYAVDRGVFTTTAVKGRRSLAAIILAVATGSLAYATVLRNRDYHSGFAMWTDVVAKRPNNPRAYDSLAIAWEKLGRLDKAEAMFREAIRVEPDYASAYSNLGSILSQQGRVDEAIEAYRQALRIDPGYLFARVKLGDLLARRGRIDEGITELQVVVYANPHYPLARYALGNALSSKGNLDGAIEQYQQAIRIRPGYAEAHYSLGNALRDKGDSHAAIEQYREAMRINPGLVSPHNNLGHVLLRLGRFEEAARQFREALRLDPRHAGARYGLTDALAR